MNLPNVAHEAVTRTPWSWFWLLYNLAFEPLSILGLRDNSGRAFHRKGGTKRAVFMWTLCHFLLNIYRWIFLAIFIVYNRCIYCIYFKTLILCNACFILVLFLFATINFGPKSRILYKAWNNKQFAVFHVMLIRSRDQIQTNFTQKFTFKHMYLHVHRCTWIHVYMTQSQVSHLNYDSTHWSINFHSKQNQGFYWKIMHHHVKYKIMSN